jgi:hypothetical protein
MKKDEEWVEKNKRCKRCGAVYRFKDCLDNDNSI